MSVFPLSKGPCAINSIRLSGKGQCAIRCVECVDREKHTPGTRKHHECSAVLVPLCARPTSSAAANIHRVMYCVRASPKRRREFDHRVHTVHQSGATLLHYTLLQQQSHLISSGQHASMSIVMSSKQASTAANKQQTSSYRS